MSARLYLLDDHALVRDGLRSLLEAAGHVVVGESADPGVALSDVQRLTPDVVLLDLSLGERSGFELLSELRRCGQASRCIVLTMSAQPRHVAEALRLGAQGYVLKGSPSSELLQAVQAVGLGRRFLGSTVPELAAQALTLDPVGDPFAPLSPRERQIVRMVVDGRSSALIGAQLHLSPKTVDSYRSRLMAKLHVGDVTALVKLALRHGLITPDPH